MLKIVIPHHIPDPANATGGVSAHVLNLAETLGRVDGTSVSVISLGARDATTELGNISFKTIKTEGWYKYIFWWPLFRLAMAIRKERPDIIHIQGATFNPYLLASTFMCPRRVRKVITIHGLATEENIVIHSLKKESARQQLTIWAEKQIVRHFDKVICVTSGLKAKLEMKYGNQISAKTVVIPNGVDCQCFCNDSPPPTRFIEDDYLGKKKMTLLVAKALSTTNGQEFLVRALPIILESIPETTLLIAGDGDERTRLETISHELGVRTHVQFLGNVRNDAMRDLLCRSDVVIIPSVRIGGVEEGSSIVLLEAMATGRPVIASDLGGLHDSIENEKTGLLVPEKNPGAIANAVVRLHKNPQFAAQIGLMARDYVAKERSWDKIAARYLKAYSDLYESSEDISKST